MNFEEIEGKLFYNFNNKNLLIQALNHPGISDDHQNNLQYERFELLGDAVLNLFITEMLLELFPQENEGDIAKRRSFLVCHENLAKIAYFIQLDKWFMINFPNTKNKINANILENTIETLVAAIYLDGGENIVKKIVTIFFKDDALNNINPPTDDRSLLQEWAQKNNFNLPDYRNLETSGPPHAPNFIYEVKIGEMSGVGSANSKKQAKKNAASNLIDILNLRDKNS